MGGGGGGGRRGGEESVKEKGRERWDTSSSGRERRIKIVGGLGKDGKEWY